MKKQDVVKYLTNYKNTIQSDKRAFLEPFETVIVILTGSFKGIYKKDLKGTKHD